MRFYLLSLYIFLSVVPGAGLAQRVVSGRVTDAETGKALPYVRVQAPEIAKATETDDAGRYRLVVTDSVTRIEFRVLGYQSYEAELRPDSVQTIDIALFAEARQLREVTVKPKKYRNKDNPAVELIDLVIRHRDKNRPGEWSTFQEKQYEKMLFGFGNVPRRFTHNRWLKSIRFIWENKDTTKMPDRGIVPMYLQENIVSVYSRNPPRQQRKFIEARKQVTFAGFADEEGADQALRYLNEGIDIYDNFVNIVSDQFLSPIANNAPLFYRYYPVDTTVLDGRRIVHLAFFPRNKTDMLLQGDLYIALDSTYPVTAVNFTINPEANLNWVQYLTAEQEFRRLPSGHYALAREDYRLYFGLTRHGMGIFGQRFVEHREALVNAPMPSDTIFNAANRDVRLPDAGKRDSTFWETNRVPLTSPELLTYQYIDSFWRTPLVRTSARVMRILFGGYWPGKYVEIGPMNEFYAFNGIEGTRLRFGGRTSDKLSPRFRVLGNVTYGLTDERWKFNVTGIYALRGTFKTFPLNLVRAGVEQDVRVPALVSFQTNNLGTSIVRGANDRFLYNERYFAQYEREWRNNLGVQVGASRQSMQPAGALQFVPAGGGEPSTAPLIVSRAYVQLRYAPKEKFLQSPASDYRTPINFNYIATVRYSKAFTGLWGGQYDLHELNASLQKFTNLPPFGYNRLLIEGNALFGRAPYPLLTIHRANPTYFYQQQAFNLMNFLEFISDRSVNVYMAHHFNGFFLNKIPLVRRLKLREIATVKAAFGMVSADNTPGAGTSLFQFPTLPDGTPITYTLDGGPYLEAGLGISNIFKIFRVDVIRRFTHLTHPGVAEYGVRVGALLEF